MPAQVTRAVKPTRDLPHEREDMHADRKAVILTKTSCLEQRQDSHIILPCLDGALSALLTPMYVTRRTYLLHSDLET